MQRVASKLGTIGISGGLALTLLVGCVENVPSVQRPDSESTIRQTVDVYRQRGFSDEAIMSLTAQAFFALPEETADALAVELGLAERVLTDSDLYITPQEVVDYDTTVMVFSQFEPDTGRRIPEVDILAYAQVATSCFANGTPWKDCALNYHPVDGCFLEGAVLNECRRVSKIMSGGGELRGADGEKCWNYAKGPSISLPYQGETVSQIKLAKTIPASVQVSVPKERINTLGRPVCTSAISNGPSCDPDIGC